eukprot:gb/GECG01003233.1/.p1 GENE.gb/GECG01003233.1/~~gb/GECG01003233.1/.p1  ORF type:complete len:169 (+),score=3.88 gb/GECG01003233.1/:1-507(+)
MLVASKRARKSKKGVSERLIIISRPKGRQLSYSLRVQWVFSVVGSTSVNRVKWKLTISVDFCQRMLLLHFTVHCFIFFLSLCINPFKTTKLQYQFHPPFEVVASVMGGCASSSCDSTFRILYSEVSLGETNGLQTESILLWYSLLLFIFSTYMFTQHHHCEGRLPEAR